MSRTEPTTVRFALSKSKLLAEALELAEQLHAKALRKEKTLTELDLTGARAARRVARLLRNLQTSHASAAHVLDELTPLRREALRLIDG